ncbi:kinase-like domain-containing protein, partial [Rhizophagus irregularis DAOM 181602=DAOM 197198]
MELVKISGMNSFDPTPKLKSSPIPILFISFNRRDTNCIHCGEEYTKTLFCNNQRYCKKCLSCYLTAIADHNIYLDEYNVMMDLECTKHEIRTKEPQVIQECCRNCLKVLCFKQIFESCLFRDLHKNLYNSVIEIVKYCKLCGKSLYKEYDSSLIMIFKLCSDCYLISFEYIESTLTKKIIPIIYLPWWHNIARCSACRLNLTITSDCQKCCKRCHILYTGCRYCLTTNIIFGLTTQSQCKKCKRITIISYFANILNENSELYEFSHISRCEVCDKSLTLISECQKYCENCLMLYINKCRYCLTTNLIFGLTTQFQCRKCNKASIVNIFSGNSELDKFLFNLFPDTHFYDVNMNVDKFIDKIKRIDKYYSTSKINSTIHSMFQNYKDSQSKKLTDQSEKLIEWIPYSQFINIMEIARGGFGIIYCATRDQKSIILKKFKNSQDTSRYFLNELKSNQNCYEIKHHIIRIHGITKDPKLGDYMLVMQYASGGDLHKWLQKSFADITWNKEKLIILWQISEGLETIHKADYIHRDFHSGNILYDLRHNEERHQWLIGDLGLSQPANNTSSNNEIYGVIPYIAPEIFKGSSFSKESDVYSMGMIMWELTTGCKPFAN